MKVLIDVNIQGIDRLVLCGSKVLQQLTQATFLCSPERQFERRIISKHEDIHWSRGSPYQTTRPNHAGFFLSVTSMTRFGTYPVTHIQSTNMVKFWTAIARTQTYYKAYDP